MTMNGAVLPVMASYIVAAEEQGVAPEQLAGTLQNDILKEFMVRNTYIYPPSPSCGWCRILLVTPPTICPNLILSLSVATICRKPGRPMCRSWRITIADGIEYVRTAIDSGMDVDKFAPRLSFFFAIGMNFFMEIAKLRAARILWATLMEEKFAPKDDALGAANPLSDLWCQPDQ